MRDGPGRLIERFISSAFFFLIQYPLLCSHSPKWFGCEDCEEALRRENTRTHANTHVHTSWVTRATTGMQRVAPHPSWTDSELRRCPPLHRGGWKDISLPETKKERLELRKGEALQLGLALEMTLLHCLSKEKKRWWWWGGSKSEL